MYPKLKGSHPWAVILCNASNLSPLTTPTILDFKDFIAGKEKEGLSDYWTQVSFGTIDLRGSNVFGWYTLPLSSGNMMGLSRGELIEKATRIATEHGVDLSPYKHVLAVATNFGGSGNVGGDVTVGLVEPLRQINWRWCRKCEGLAFWDGSRSPGRCPAGDGTHDHYGSSVYSVKLNVPISNNEQANWRWCRNCEGLAFWDGSRSPGRCPAGEGTHDHDNSGVYSLLISGNQPLVQVNWRWCRKCEGLAFWDGSRSPGRCPAGGSHDHSTSARYDVSIASTLSVGFCAHESGHGFGLEHSFSISSRGDLTNDQRPGAYGDWYDIMSWARTASFSPARFPPAGPSLNAPTLYKLGWLQDDHVLSIVTGLPRNLEVTLMALHSEMTNGYRMTRIIESQSNKIYTIEFRQAKGWDRGLNGDRIVIHELRTHYTIGQNLWRHCKNCEGMVFAGQSVCPAGGVHDFTGSTNYAIKYNVVPKIEEQNNWRWCSKCQGLTFAGNSSPRPCPAGGDHELTHSLLTMCLK